MWKKFIKFSVSTLPDLGFLISTNFDSLVQALSKDLQKITSNNLRKHKRVVGLCKSVEKFHDSRIRNLD